MDSFSPGQRLITTSKPNRKTTKVVFSFLSFKQTPPTPAYHRQTKYHFMYIDTCSVASCLADDQLKLGCDSASASLSYVTSNMVDQILSQFSFVNVHVQIFTKYEDLVWIMFLRKPLSFLRFKVFYLRSRLGANAFLRILFLVTTSSMFQDSLLKNHRSANWMGRVVGNFLTFWTKSFSV